MTEAMILAPLTFTIFSLMVGAILKHLLKKTFIPYTVGLFVVGLILGLLVRYGLLDKIPDIKDAIVTAGDIDPDLILFVFLPVLIFGAAFAMEPHIFKKTLINSSILSVLGLILAMFITGAIMMGINLIPGQSGEWSWSYALMFGALISATDPVAVVAILQEMGIDKKFSTLIDSEAMLNDGTGIVMFMMFFTAAAGAASVAGVAMNPIFRFIIVTAGGVIIGYCIAQLCLRFILKIEADEWVRNSFIIVCAYVSFILAQQFLNVSGVIALAVFGLIMSAVGKRKMEEGTLHFVSSFWDLLSYIANTLIFMIVGIVIAMKVDVTLTHILILLAVYVGVTLARAIMVQLFFPIMSRNGYGMTKQQAVVLVWSGLRGATGLCLALMVANSTLFPESIRSQILFYTAGIVTLTLLINATTMKRLLKYLHIDKNNPL